MEMENSSVVGSEAYYVKSLLRNDWHGVPAGTARTSLVVTIGPSPQHRGETASTIMFGQRVSHYHHSNMREESESAQVYSGKY
jgi:hypothetical protein